LTNINILILITHLSFKTGEAFEKIAKIVLR